MKNLTPKQISLVENEAFLERTLNEDYILQFSKRLWNKYKIAVRVYFKDGSFWKAEKN